MCSTLWRVGVGSDYCARTVAGERLTIRGVTDQSTPLDCGSLDEPDLYLDFSDCVVRLFRVDLTPEGLELHYVVTPSV